MVKASKQAPQGSITSRPNCPSPSFSTLLLLPMYHPFSTCLLTEKKKNKKNLKLLFPYWSQFCCIYAFGISDTISWALSGFLQHYWHGELCAAGLNHLSLQSIPSTLLQLLKFGWFLCSSAIATCETQTFFVALPITLVSLSHCYVTFWQFCLPYWVTFLSSARGLSSCWGLVICLQL